MSWTWDMGVKVGVIPFVTKDSIVRINFSIWSQSVGFTYAITQIFTVPTHNVPQ